MNKTSNINRITSEFLRMIGGRIDWILGVLHIKNDSDDYAKIKVKSVELENVTIEGPSVLDETHTLRLPNSSGNSGEALLTDGSGNLSWGQMEGVTPRVYEVIMTIYTLTYILPNIPLAGSPVQVTVNGIGVDFTQVFSTITITTYTPGEVFGNELLRVYYYTQGS